MIYKTVLYPMLLRYALFAFHWSQISRRKPGKHHLTRHSRRVADAMRILFGRYHSLLTPANISLTVRT